MAKPSWDCVEKATLGGGCFWCLDAAFRRIEGIEEVVSGYAGGTSQDPTYEEVCGGRSGHAEVVQLTFDPEVISLREILEIFFTLHDPTTVDRQGHDVGTQYRSIILTHDRDQEKTAYEVIKELQPLFDDAIVTHVVPLQRFWPAEPEHQDYYDKHPAQGYCLMVIRPKLGKLRKKWAHRIRD